MMVLRKNKYSVVIPYYNEEEYLGKTLFSWLSQEKKPDQMILVDNGSTDRSTEAVLKVLDGPDCRAIEIKYLKESKPGKIHALKQGCAAVNCEFTVMSDADTYYPPHYLAQAERMFRNADKSVSALMALPEYSKPDAISSKIRRRYFVLLSKIFKKHAFTGGYGQIFRTDALEKAGGFSETIWPHVLLDHEIMYRIFKNGRTKYHVDLWCQSSLRRSDRRRVRWNLMERLMYQFTPHRFQEWFFYRYLATHFQKRGLNQLRLREKPWENND
jgi:glycosyltransferase involved in cell wall biosynthesis